MLVSEAAVENALPIAVFLSGRLLYEIIFVAQNYVPTNNEISGEKNFILLSTEITILVLFFSIDCVFQC